MKPTRCVDPVMKFCQECKYGWVDYGEWFESGNWLIHSYFASGCTLGYDQGRPEDEPTEEEFKEFEEWYKH